MALKFLNKKGWHTGSLRNIENVWKAEQKHEQEQKKLDELRKQIAEEKERSEFREMQIEAGLIPRQERLEFLYDSGLAVGKGSSSSGGGGFKALETPSLPPPPTKAPDDSASTKLQQPGALFEEKQQSSNDAWRKLHSDPLLLIRQREQEALSRVKNNPVQMAMIRKSVEATKSKKKIEDVPRKKHHHRKKHESSRYQSDSSEDESSGGDAGRRSSSHRKDKYKEGRSSKHHSDLDNYGSKEGRKSSNQRPSSEDELSGGDAGRRRDKYEEGRSSKHHSDSKEGRKSNNQQADKLSGGDAERRSSYKYNEGRSSGSKKNVEVKDSRDEGSRSEFDGGRRLGETKPPLSGGGGHRKRNAVKLSEEERSARLREMQMDAEIHEEQRWKRLKKAEERDVVEEAVQGKGRNFLDDVHKSVYGTAKGGSSTVEESVRRRTHYSQGRSEAGEGNAFRR